MARNTGSVMALVLLASCVAPPPPPPPPPPTPAPPPPPPPAPPPADWRYAPVTPGTWSWAQEGARSIASFGPAGQPPAVRFACDAGRITIAWPARMAATAITVTTTYGARALPAAGGAITLGARDPLLDQIAYSRGRFMLAAEGAAVILPAWPEIARVVEDCRG